MKKGLLWAICILLGITVTYAQNTKTPTFNRHQVGFGFTNEANNLRDVYYSNFYSDPKWGYGFALQATYHYRPVQWFSLETGVGYKNYANRITYNRNPIYFAVDLAYSNNENPDIDRVHAMYLPVNFRFHYQRNKVGFFVRTGATFNWLMVTSSKQDEFYKFNRYSHVGNETRDDITMSINMGLGIDYSVTERWMIRAETVYSMNNLVTQREMHMFNEESLRHSLGLNLTVYYAIGK